MVSRPKSMQTLSRELYHKTNEAGNLWFARIAILFSEELSCCFSLLRQRIKVELDIRNGQDELSNPLKLVTPGS